MKMITFNYKIVYCLMIVCDLCCFVVIAKSLDHHQVRLKRTVQNNNNNNNKNCKNVENFFQMKNISLISSIENKPGSLCGGDCCDDKTETLLRKQGQKDFAALLQHNSRSLQGLLTSTATTLQNHVSELARQSENKTLLLFSQVYRGMAVLSKEPLNNLYNDIRQYIQVDDGTKTTTTTTIEIKESVTKFFTDLFPLVYHHSANTPEKDFTLDYKMCLKRSIDTILPFGDIPRQISQSLTKSLEACRLLLQAFNVGIEVLNTTDTLLIDEQTNTNQQCHNALLRMTYCPKCKGYTIKPCSGYCLNVIRGCIAKYVAELDMPWSGYVEGIESLVNAMKRNNNNNYNNDVMMMANNNNVNVDAAIRNLDQLILNAIMYSMENIKEIDNRVKRNCGVADFSQKEDPLILESSTYSPQLTTNGKPARFTNQRIFTPLPESELERFLLSIGKTKGFYNYLADTLCDDENFAELKDQHCWNGERIADYTKTVVDVGLNAQKYNPEFKPNSDIQNVDSRIANLVDKLRHVHHMALNSVGQQNSDDYMQRDEGSGSGYGPDFNPDGDEDDESVRGSGSGSHPYIETDSPYNKSPPETSTENDSKTAGTETRTPCLLFTLFMLIITFKLYV